jgi:Adenovirus EB1 55K protein / large t-antigen
MEIRGDSNVVVENVRFECQTDERNTIDLFGGQLHLKDCEVFASSRHSFDCVRARSHSVFVADRCSFQSMEHAAIFGDVDSSISLLDSKVSFPGNVDFGPKRACVQAEGATGFFQGCEFIGPCNAGIDWSESPQQELKIESCRFDNCKVGIRSKNGGSVEINGTEERLCELTNVRFGISLVESKAKLNRFRVVSSDASDKVGLQVSKGSQVQCNGGYIEGMPCGILVNQSELIVTDDIEIHQTTFAGLLADESSVKAEKIQLIDVEQFGLVVLSTKAQVQIASLFVSAPESSDPKVTLAICATSGDLQIDESEIRNCLSSICVDTDRKIIDDVGSARKSILAELLEARKQSDQPQPVIRGNRMMIENCEYVWLFAGTGTSKIKEIVADMPSERLAPRILFPESLERKGSDYTDFSVVLKTDDK